MPVRWESGTHGRFTRSERRRRQGARLRPRGSAVTGAPGARAAHAERLIRQRSDVTPLGRARSAPRSHCSGDSRRAHSRLGAPCDCGPRPAPGAGSSGKRGRAAPLQQGAWLSASQAVCRWLLKLPASPTADRFRKARPMNSRFKTFSNSNKTYRFSPTEKTDLGFNFKC